MKSHADKLDYPDIDKPVPNKARSCYIKVHT